MTSPSSTTVGATQVPAANDALASSVAAPLPYGTTALPLIGRYMTPVVIIVMDYLAVLSALMTAAYLRAVFIPLFVSGLETLNINDENIVYVIPFFYICFLAYEGMYSKRLPFWQATEHIFKISMYVAALLVVISYFLGEAIRVSRIFVSGAWMLNFLFLLAGRDISRRILFRCGLWQKPVVIIGAGKTAESLAKIFANDPHIGYKIVGLIVDNRDRGSGLSHYARLGTFAQAEQVIGGCRVDDVIIAAPELESEQLIDLVYRIQPYVKNLSVIPDLLGFPLGNITVEPFFNEKVILLKINNNLMSPADKIIKRLFDIVVVVITLPLILPILLLIALAIKVDSPGPALYIARRIGINGREFFCYKFRSMHLNTETVLEKYLHENPAIRKEWEVYAKLKEYDPRVTRLGRLLRKYSLDELPQLINVVKGDMSLVGPRPYLPREVVSMGASLQTIVGCIPGITGLWQVSGRNEITFAGRLGIDCWYVRNWSIWLDVMLLCKTVKVVLAKRGAY